MDVTVSGRHTEVSEALRAVAEEKIGRLARFVDGMDRAEVHFFVERNPRIADKEVCEVTLEGHGHHVRCRVAAPDGFAAIDRAVEKLEHQLHKLKSKLLRRHAPPRRGDGTRAATGDLELADDLFGGEAQQRDGDERPRIVKTKRFAMKPMPPEEAALQMDLLGHDFFFFANSDTGRSAVVYRRADGDVGLIDEA